VEEEEDVFFPPSLIYLFPIMSISNNVLFCFLHIICGVVINISGQEKRISIYDATTGKFVRAIPIENESGETIKNEFDPSGQYLAISSQDRHIRIYCFKSGELIAKVSLLVLLKSNSSWCCSLFSIRHSSFCFIV
jgi:WD40 repeat protein